MEAFMFKRNRLPAESTTPPGTPPRGALNFPSTPGNKLGETTSSPTKRRYVADTSDVEAVKKIKLEEIELRDRNTVLRGFKSNVSSLQSILSDSDITSLPVQNFNNVRIAFAEKLKKLKESGKGGAAASASGAQSCCITTPSILIVLQAQIPNYKPRKPVRPMLSCAFPSSD